MAERHPIWRWLPAIALGLMLIGDFAPVSDLLEKILSGVAITLLLSFSGSYYWQQRRERRAAHSNSTAISSKDQM